MIRIVKLIIKKIRILELNKKCIEILISNYRRKNLFLIVLLIKLNSIYSKLLNKLKMIFKIMFRELFYKINNLIIINKKKLIKSTD